MPDAEIPDGKRPEGGTPDGQSAGWTPADEFAEAQRLYQAGDDARAEPMLRSLRAVDDPQVAARATGTLGLLLLHRDGPDAALEVFGPLMDSGLPAAAGFAATEVGLILRSRGDLAGAEAAFRQAVDCPTASVAVEAALNLGVLLDVRGEPTEARAVLWAALERVLSPFDPLRAAVLGLATELEKGPPADDMTPPELAASIASALAAARGFRVLGDLGLIDRAIAAWRRVLETDPPAVPGFRARCAASLADCCWLRFSRSADPADLDAAIAAALTSRDETPPGAPEAGHRAVNLAMMLERRFADRCDPADLRDAVAACRGVGGAARTRARDALHRLYSLSDDPDVLREWVATASAVVAQAREPSTADLVALGLAMSARHTTTRAVADEAAAAAVWEQVLAVTVPRTPERAEALTFLGLILRARFQHERNRADIDRAIDLARETQELALDGPAAHAAALFAEAGARRERYVAFGGSADLDRAIELLDRLLADPAELSRSELNYTLAIALSDRFEGTGELGDLDAAVDRYGAAVDTAEGDDQRRAMAAGLSATLLLRHQHTGSPDDLDAAGRWGSETATDGGPDDATLRGALNVAATLDARYRLHGDRRDVDRAAELLRSIPPAELGSDRQRAILFNNLANILLTRYRGAGDPADLDDAIERLRDAITAEPTPAPDAVSRLANLATALSMLFERTGELHHLDEAVVVAQAAVDATPGRSVELGAHLDGLAGLLARRAVLRRSGPDLAQSRRLRAAAVEATPDGSPERRRFLLNLGVAMLADAADDDVRRYGLSAVMRAVDLTPPDAADRDAYLTILGEALVDRMLAEREPVGLDRALGMLREVLDRTPDRDVTRAQRLAALARAHQARFSMHGRAEDLEECFTLFRAACLGGVDLDPDATVGRARTWAGLAVAHHRWETAVEAYAIALSALHELFRRQALRAEKELWLAQGPDLVGDAAYAMVRSDDLREAAATLEAGRALIASESLNVAAADLDGLPDGALPQRYRDAASRLRLVSARAGSAPEHITGRDG